MAEAHGVDVDTTEVLAVLQGIPKIGNRPDVEIAQIVAEIESDSADESHIRSVLTSLLRNEF